MNPRDAGRIPITVPKGLEDLAPAYLQARRDDVDQATRFLREGDLRAVIKIAHNFAGSGTSYGFERLSELGADLERSARAGDAMNSREHLGALRDYLDRVELC